jgi:hypothetical protein
MDALTARFIPAPYMLSLREDVVWPASLAAGAPGTGTGGGGGAAPALGRPQGFPAPPMPRDTSINAVTDLAFLHGHALAPALALLSAQYPTSTARLAQLAHTSALTVVGIDAARRRHTVLWRRDGRPHDAFAIVPLPEPLGGVLVMSPHSVQYFAQLRYAGIATSAYATVTVDTAEYPLAPARDELGQPCCAALGGAIVHVLAPALVLIAAPDGLLFVLRLHATAAGVVTGMTLTPAGISAGRLACVATLPAAPAAARALRAAEGGAGAANTTRHKSRAARAH